MQASSKSTAESRAYMLRKSGRQQTADWTTFDTIGGYIPSNDGLRFEPGILLRALKRGRWVVIDELNRADIDKAFGPLFSLLAAAGGSITQRRVVLPYQEQNTSVEIRFAERRTTSASTSYIITPGWRLLGTLNLSDKATLFQLSFAFLRRFAVIDVPLPEEEGYRVLVAGRMPVNLDSDLRDTLLEASMQLAFGPRQLGPAILCDIAMFVDKALAETATGKPAYTSPVDAFVTATRLFAVPQYEGAAPTDANAVLDIVRRTLPSASEGSMFALEGALRAVQLS